MLVKYKYSKMLANSNREQSLVKTLIGDSTSLRLFIYEKKKITDSFCQPYVDRSLESWKRKLSFSKHCLTFISTY